MAQFSRKNLILSAVAAIILLLILGVGMLKYVDYKVDQLALIIDEESKRSEEKFDAKVKDLGDLFSETLTAEQKKNTNLQDKLSKVTNTVENLEKLSATDKELLKKYSKVYFLNEHYVPIDLSAIDKDFVSGSAQNFQIHSDVLPFLEDLFEDARDEDLSLLTQSAYRSFGTQSVLKAGYTVTYGAGTANQFSADQGYSEHQLGTTLDFTTANLKGALEGFDKTPEYEWLLENAHRYGFVLSYPAGNAYYKFEPWHWRFVGVDLATKLHKDKMNFYDMDQRVIDSYLGKIFDN